MTPDELRALCARWQERLELQDWHVEVGIGRARDVDGDEHGGLCHYTLSQRYARITLRAADDYPPDALVPHDYERTLAHELLHLHFAPFAADDGTPEDTAQEQAINALSRALVRLARGQGGTHGAHESCPQADQAERAEGTGASAGDLRQ